MPDSTATKAASYTTPWDIIESSLIHSFHFEAVLGKWFGLIVIFRGMRTLFEG